MLSRSWTTLGSVPMRARCRTSECGKTTAAARAVAAAATLLAAPEVRPHTRRPAGRAHGRRHGHGPARTPTELRTDFVWGQWTAALCAHSRQLFWLILVNIHCGFTLVLYIYIYMYTLALAVALFPAGCSEPSISFFCYQHFVLTLERN